MLRLARPEDPGFVRALCASPGNARLLDPPGAGEIGDALADDLLFIWEEGGAPVGFALMVEWVPAVNSIRAFAVAPGGGAALPRGTPRASLRRARRLSHRA